MTPITISIPSFISPEAFSTIYQGFYSDIIKLSSLYQKGQELFQQTQKFNDVEILEKNNEFEKARQEARNGFINKN